MYTKTSWVNRTAPYLEALNLNHMEKGIFDNSNAIDAIGLGETAKGEWTPTAGTEYPSSPTLGDSYFIAGLSSPYLFTGGDLNGKTTDNQDKIYYSDVGWILVSQRNIPTDIVKYVDTIADFSTIDINTYTVVTVKEEGRGGTFNYDASQSGTNNGGTIFDGWVRQYDGIINVKWFGAKGDGITDDTAAIQKAFNLYMTTYIPEGEYVVTSTLNMNNPLDTTEIRPCVSIQGDGMSKSILLATDMSTVVLDHNHTIETSEAFSRTEGVFWNDFAIIGQGATTIDNHGIKIHGTFRSSLNNVVIRNMGGNGIHMPYDITLEATGGYSGGSDVYGCQLNMDNVFLHGNQGSGIFSDMFSANMSLNKVLSQDNGEWGYVLSGANIVMQGGTAGYNGRKVGLIDGQGGGLLIGTGVETTPMTWDITNMEFDRNKFHDIDIVRGKNLNISNNRFLDSDDNAGEFWATSQIRGAGALCVFNNNYFRLPSDTNKSSILFEFVTGSTNNIVDTFDIQPGISTGVTFVLDVSTETPGNIVKQNYKDTISLNRPMSNKMISVSTVGSMTVTGSPTEIPIIPADLLYYTNHWVNNVFTVPTSGIYRVSGFVEASTFNGTTSNQIGVLLRINRGSGATTEKRNITVDNIANTGDNVLITFDFIIGLYTTDTIGLQIFSSPRSCELNTDVAYSNIVIEML